MLLSEFFETVYTPLRLLGRSGRTITLYRRSIQLFSLSLGRPADLADLTDLAVSRHLAGLMSSGAARTTVNKERSQLLAIWNVAAKKRYVDQFPEVRSVSEPERVPHAWTADQLWRLRISCNMQPGKYHGVPANRWWLALHQVLYATGERISAVMRTRWEDLTGNVLVFPAENRKGSAKPNVCHLPESAVEALQTIREPQRDLVFPWPHSETYLYRAYSQILARAELPNGRDQKFHALRRTHATHLKAAGGDPTASLGHSNPQTTQAYLDPRQLPKRVVGVLPDFPESTRAG